MPLGRRPSPPVRRFTASFSGRLVQASAATATRLQLTKLARQASLNGAALDGRLLDAWAAGPMRNARMTTVFDDIQLSGGAKTPVNVQLMSLRAFSPTTHHLRAVGMIAGAIAGHEAAVHSGTQGGALASAVSGYALSDAQDRYRRSRWNGFSAYASNGRLRLQPQAARNGCAVLAPRSNPASKAPLIDSPNRSE